MRVESKVSIKNTSYMWMNKFIITLWQFMIRVFSLRQSILQC